jgi:hypothetical protein
MMLAHVVIAFRCVMPHSLKTALRAEQVGYLPCLGIAMTSFVLNGEAYRLWKRGSRLGGWHGPIYNSGFP